MHYTYNPTLSRIEITAACGTVVAFVTADAFGAYPYFNWLLSREPF